MVTALCLVYNPILYKHGVLKHAWSEFGDLAKSQMCCGELAKSQTVLETKFHTMHRPST
jgi:hypothetical protein